MMKLPPSQLSMRLPKLNLQPAGARFGYFPTPWPALQQFQQLQKSKEYSSKENIPEKMEVDPSPQP